MASAHQIPWMMHGWIRCEGRIFFDVRVVQFIS
jgi:hypothetical protein